MFEIILIIYLFSLPILFSYLWWKIDNLRDDLEIELNDVKFYRKYVTYYVLRYRKQKRIIDELNVQLQGEKFLSDHYNECFLKMHDKYNEQKEITDQLFEIAVLRDEKGRYMSKEQWLEANQNKEGQE